MKLSALFLALSLIVTLNANQTIFEQYAQLKQELKSAKVEADRNIIVQSRDEKREIRDYRDVIRENRLKAAYARIENSYTPYR